MFFKKGLQLNKQFAATAPGLQLSYLLYLLQYHAFLQVQAHGFALMFIIRLWRMAQQPTDSL
jgi:hypothetical protein